MKRKESLFSIISSHFNLPFGFEFSDDLLLIDLPAWDSIEGVELIHKIENDMKIEFELEEIASFQTVGQIYQAIENHSINK